MAIKGEGAGPSSDDLTKLFSTGPAKPSGPASSSGPNFAAALGGGGAGLGWSAEDQARYGINAATANLTVGGQYTAGANIRELERTGGASGGGTERPGGTETIGAVLQRLNAMQANELTILQQKLYLAGYYGKTAKPEDVKFGIADTATMKAFTTLLKDASNTSGEQTWDELLGAQVALRGQLAQEQGAAASAASAAAAQAAHDAAVKSAESEYRNANSPEGRARAAETLKELNTGLPSLVEHYDPQKQIQHLDPEHARSALTSAFKDAVGRAPSETELSKFVANYDSAAKSHPVITQSDRNAAGVITSRQSGGVDSEPIARSLYVNNPEYANYQAVAKYFPAVESVLAGKDLTTL